MGYALLAIFAVGIQVGGFGRTRQAKCNLGSMENPYFRAVGAVCHIWPYLQVQGPYSVMQSRASPGSYGGNDSAWVLFLWSIGVILWLCFRSAISYLVQEHPKTAFLDPKHHLWTNKVKRDTFYERSAILCPMVREIAKGLFSVSE